jgi:hypothetical protein
MKCKGGFRKIGDLPEDMAWRHQTCFHPEHNPPGHIVLKPGLYEYTCPGCGRSVMIRIPEIRW